MSKSRIKNSETYRAVRLMFIGKADFSFHSHSYGMNERSKKINSVDLANEPKAQLSASLLPIGIMPACRKGRLAVIGGERVFKPLH